MDYEQILDLLIQANEGTLDPIYNAITVTRGTDDLVIVRIDDDLYIFIKGTERYIREWFYNFCVTRMYWLDMGLIERGFAINAQRLFGVENDPDSVVNMCLNTKGKIHIFGHSRAGVIAPLMGTLCLDHGIDKNKLDIVVFGSPKSGNAEMRRNYNQVLHNQTTTINGEWDPVTFVPNWGYHYGKIKTIKLAWHSLRNYRNKIKTLVS